MTQPLPSESRYKCAPPSTTPSPACTPFASNASLNSWLCCHGIKSSRVPWIRYVGVRYVFLCTLAQRTYGSDLFVLGLGEIGVISADVCALADGGGFGRKIDEEDGEGLAFPVHVQDDAGARVRGRHPAADFLVLGRDVVACDLGSASIFRSTVGRGLGKGGH